VSLAQRVCKSAIRQRLPRSRAAATIIPRTQCTLATALRRLRVVPMWDVAHAVAEVAYSLDELKLQGVCLFASYGERFLGDSWSNPVLEALNGPAAVVFVHPALHPCEAAAQPALPEVYDGISVRHDRAAVNLVFRWRDRALPRIRFVLAHAGGSCPIFAWRLSVSRYDRRPDGTIVTPGRYSRLRRFWYDKCTVAGGEDDAMPCGVAAPRPNRVRQRLAVANARVIAEAVKSP